MDHIVKKCDICINVDIVYKKSFFYLQIKIPKKMDF